MSKKKGRRKKSTKAAASRSNSRLASHEKHGRTLKSPLNAMSDLRLYSWLRDEFPDYLWSCFHLSRDLEDGSSVLIGTLDRVNACLDRELGNQPSDRPALDGSLASWEEVPESARAAVIADLREAGAYDAAVPPDVAHMLGMYPAGPGAWLVNGWRQAGLSIDPEVAERVLDATIRESLNGRGPVATRAKAIAFRGMLHADRLRFMRGIDELDMLPRYPSDLDPDEVEQVESFIRATFSAGRRIDGDGERDPENGWPARFWRANWRIYTCRLVGAEQSQPNDDEVRAALAEFSDAIDSMWADFDDVAFKTDPDLFNPDRYEVLTGITARSLRILASGVGSPASWTTEHSAPLVRSMVEALITISWLVSRDDEAMYRRFKDFGRGRLKLLKLHMEEHVDALDAVPADLAEQLARLDALVNEDLSEEFQNIDLGGSFSGVDLRRMAYEVGLESEYRLIYSPSSSDFHGEWGHMARYALTRCANPAHRFHRILRKEAWYDLSPSTVQTAVELARRGVDAYIGAIAASSESDSV